ncbi:sugar transferase [Cellvibrio zantedeschiae]|uniref:Sugar transferase n=1 Tax=Cellvibrio zantedeschiae TaxID=1237077 RepID=A0ABQ3B5F0_9GAMM|nr:HAD-IA family hydrolase [Cellvibrio zantedeschiae]GGY80164.1 sugar transferase [Cellvibrio zantedeschiae]
MLVIFDCDGVLVDSEILSAQVFSESLAERYGIHVSPYYSLESYRGKSVPDCISMITAELTEKLNWQDVPQAERDERGRAFWRHVQLQTLAACDDRLFAVEGVEAVLKNLKAKSIPFCVASNGKHEKMAVTLVKTNLMSYVDGNIFSFEDVARGKPAPDLFLHAAKTMNVPAAEAIVVEDSLTGVIAAKAAGMRALAYCPPDEEGKPNNLIGKMTELGAECFFHMDELVELIFKSK